MNVRDTSPTRLPPIACDTVRRRCFCHSAESLHRRRHPFHPAGYRGRYVTLLVIVGVTSLEGEDLNSRLMLLIVCFSQNMLFSNIATTLRRSECMG